MVVFIKKLIVVIFGITAVAMTATTVSQVNNNHEAIADINDNVVAYNTANEESNLETYVVNFDSNGGSNVEMQNVISGQTINEPAAPTKNGYTFTGWYINDEKVSFPYTVVESVTMTAKWEEYIDPNRTYNVTFMKDGYVYCSMSARYGESVTLYGDVRSDYNDFVGWTDEDGNIISFPYTVTRDVILTSQWVKKENVTIKFINNMDGSLIDSWTVPNGYVVDQIPEPTYPGYTFIAWYLDGGSERLELGKVLIKDTIAYTYFERSGNERYYTVSYNSNGGSNVPTQTLVGGQSLYEPAEPTKEGHKFLGWYLYGQEANFPYVIGADLIFEARWEELEKVNVSFVVDGNSYYSSTAYINSSVQTPAEPTKEGYKFLGWYINDTRANFPYEVTTDVSFIAKWTEASSEEDVNKPTVNVKDKYNLSNEFIVENLSGSAEEKTDIEGTNYYMLKKVKVKDQDASFGSVDYEIGLNTADEYVKETKSGIGIIAEKPGTLTVYVYTTNEDRDFVVTNVESGQQIYSQSIERKVGTVITVYLPEAGTYEFGGTSSLIIYSASFVEDPELDIVHQTSKEGSAYRVISTIEGMDISRVSQITMTFTAVHSVDPQANKQLTGTIELFKVYDSITDLEGYGVRDDEIYYAVFVLEGINEDEFLGYKINTTVNVVYEGVTYTTQTVNGILIPYPDQE